MAYKLSTSPADKYNEMFTCSHHHSFVSWTTKCQNLFLCDVSGCPVYINSQDVPWTTNSYSFTSPVADLAVVGWRTSMIPCPRVVSIECPAWLYLHLLLYCVLYAMIGYYTRYVRFLFQDTALQKMRSIHLRQDARLQGFCALLSP